MTAQSQTRLMRLGSAKALTRGGPDPGIEFNLHAGLNSNLLAMRVASVPQPPDRSGRLRITP